MIKTLPRWCSELSMSLQKHSDELSMKNAPSTFIMLMNTIFRPLIRKSAVIYIVLSVLDLSITKYKLLIIRPLKSLDYKQLNYPRADLYIRE